MTQTRSTRNALTLTDVRDLATLPVWHADKPSAAAVLGIGRSLAYLMAERGDLPTIRLGGRVVVPVPALLAMLGDGPQLTADQMPHAGNRVASHELTPGALTDQSA
jgi:hypothetical protein